MAQKKTSRAERKAEEARVIAEMDEAMKNLPAADIAGGNGKAGDAERSVGAAHSASLENGGKGGPENAGREGPKAAEEPRTARNQTENGKTSKADAAYGSARNPMPSQIHCRKCGTVMENGVCPKCGYKVYVPMDEKKLRKIRWIVGGICLVGLLVWLLVTNLNK